MPSLAALTLLLADFALIALLPRIFFKKGSFNLRWILTGAPYFLSAIALVLAYTGHLGRLPGTSQRHLAMALEVLGVVLAFGSACLMGFVLGTHQKPLALWHQDDDAPEHIVTHGAYARIRHPFYTSFLLALTGALCVSPTIGTVATLAYGAIAMTVTAKREEGRLAASEFGEEYKAYMQRTGRFFPRLGA